MRILIIHQLQLPILGEPVTGEGLRVAQLMHGLQEYGHVVRSLVVGDRAKQELYVLCEKEEPDVIIVMQASLVPIFATLSIPIIFDLYAQRMMEAQFERTPMDTTMEVLLALRAASLVLVSNHRQRWSWQGVLSMLGAKLSTLSIVVVPLSSSISMKESTTEELRLIGGGMSWPWQNPWPSLERALAYLDKRGVGEIWWFGAQEKRIVHPRLVYKNRTSHHDFREALLSAHAAFDWMESNVEREFAIAFRHMDYMGCGLPILTGSYSPLKDLIPEGCWITEHIETALADIIDHPQKIQQAAQKIHTFARQQTPENTVRVLHDWLNNRTQQKWMSSPLCDTISLWKDFVDIQNQVAVLEYANRSYQQDLLKKDAEIEVQNQLIQQQTGTIAQLSQSISDVVSYRKEAMVVLGGQLTQKSQSAQDLTAENAILRADIAKKTAELEAMDQLRARLENDIQALREENLKKSRLFRR